MQNSGSVYNQVGTHLLWIIHGNPNTGVHGSGYHHRAAAQQLFHGIAQHRCQSRHHSRQNCPCNAATVNFINLQNTFQLRSVIIGGFIGGNTRSEENLLTAQSSNHNVGIAYVNG